MLSPANPVGLSNFTPTSSDSHRQTPHFKKCKPPVLDKEVEEDEGVVVKFETEDDNDEEDGDGDKDASGVSVEAEGSKAEITLNVF